MPALLGRFDINKDGVLDTNEWSLAVQEAKREVEEMMREAQTQPDTNFISRPPNGKFYLISNFSKKPGTRSPRPQGRR